MVVKKEKRKEEKEKKKKEKKRLDCAGKLLDAQSGYHLQGYEHKERHSTQKQIFKELERETQDAVHVHFKEGIGLTQNVVLCYTKLFTDCSIKSRPSRVVHFSRPFHALSFKWLPSFLHTCIILCILLLYLLSDEILYPNLPSTFALDQPFFLYLHYLYFCGTQIEFHSFTRFRMSKTLYRKRES